MRITVVAVGSRGDTQPYVALARALRQSGHGVCVCAGDNFRDFVTGYGLDFVPVGVDTQHFINVRIPEVLETGRNTFQGIRLIVREGMTFADRLRQGMQIACENTGAIIANILAVEAYNIAEAHDIPFFWAHSTPLLGPTSAMPPILLPVQRNLGKPLNLLAHELVDDGMWQLMRKLVNESRHVWGLKPLNSWRWPFDRLNGRPVQVLYAHSPSVTPRPEDWPDQWQVTGYWFLDAPDVWQPPDALIDFLDSGPPPVYIGFGSMSNRDPAQITDIALAALKKSRQRGLLFTGWGGVSARDMPDDVFVMESAPHDWIFPRMAAVIHHGGAGTTAAGLRAGVPSLIVPFFGDQYFWGQKIRHLGVGEKPIPRNRLDPDKLATAIQRMVTDRAMRTRAAELSEQIRAEDGLGTAVDIINRSLDSFCPTG